MSLAMTEGLSTEQAPPLSVPFAFFAVAPLAVIAAGAALLMGGGSLLASKWTPTTVAATHLGTLGFLTVVMMGALYQMVPVLSGAPVPGIRLAYGTHLALVTGTSALVVALWTGVRPLLWPATILLILAFLLFGVPMGVALVRAPARNDTVMGMRLAVIALGVVAVLGIRMVLAYASGTFPAERADWLSGHVALGLLTWVGGLLVAVSWQVIPMFYVAPSFPREVTRFSLWTLLLSLLAVPLALFVDGLGIALSAFPAVVVVWIVNPVMCLILIAHRKRARADASLMFWRTGLVIALLLPVVAGLALMFEDERWSVLMGWLAVWGWAGLVVHGMLTRIVPFLVWFHRFAALVGLVPTPPMRRLWPARHARLGYWLHVGAVGTGTVAILTGWGVAAWLAGATLIATGTVVLVAIVRALAYPVPGKSATGA